jgi:hypothetical protein
MRSGKRKNRRRRVSRACRRTSCKEEALHMNGSLRIQSMLSFQALVLYDGRFQALRKRSCTFMNDVQSIIIQLAQHFPAGARDPNTNKRYSSSESSLDLPATGVVPARGVVPKLSNPLSVIKRPPSTPFAGNAGSPDSWRSFSYSSPVFCSCS